MTIAVTRSSRPRPRDEHDWLDTLEDDAADQAQLDPSLFRQSVALFTTGIVVVTCVDEGGKVHGVTVNSFTSVSLEPPTVLVSLKPGKANGLITTQGCYGASILHAAQQPYSAHFSGRPQASLQPEFQVRDRVPTLRDCLAWFECAVLEKVQVHDHTLFVAEVRACGNQDGTPLTFYASRYHLASIKAE
jgi:flavin reductase (DIM6/NTAB) family NADH-FMN oxidoreductase RutF